MNNNSRLPPNAIRDARIERLIARQAKQVTIRPSAHGWRRIARLKTLISPERVAELEAVRGLL